MIIFDIAWLAVVLFVLVVGAILALNALGKIRYRSKYREIGRIIAWEEALALVRRGEGYFIIEEGGYFFLYYVNGSLPSDDYFKLRRDFNESALIVDDYKGELSPEFLEKEWKIHQCVMYRPPFSEVGP